jgi:hypothetical protein
MGLEKFNCELQIFIFPSISVHFQAEFMGVPFETKAS